MQRAIAAASSFISAPGAVYAAIPYLVRAGPWSDLKMDGTCPLRQLQEMALCSRICRPSSLTRFARARCELRHKPAFENPIIFWTSREV
jgi:hypothetical protein